MELVVVAPYSERYYNEFTEQKNYYLWLSFREELVPVHKMQTRQIVPENLTFSFNILHDFNAHKVTKSKSFSK